MDDSPSTRRDPPLVGDVLSQLFALRGYGRRRGDRQLHDIWAEVAGETIARQTRVAAVRNGVLQVGVASSGLLSELDAFHKPALLERLQREHPHLRVADIRFRLRGDLKR